MGPRTLCNACVSLQSTSIIVEYKLIYEGLVHMKLQRKRRKELEKETVALEGR
jgi:hypothetical protein